MEKLRILTISGWTQTPQAFEEVFPHAESLDYADASSIEHIAKSIGHNDYDIVIGWSLGGILARQLLNYHSLNAKALISVAAPLQFVRDHRITDAMAADTFEQFYQNFSEDTERTVTRFHGLLAKGDKHGSEILKQRAEHHDRIHEADAWLAWMDFLRQYSALDHAYDNLPPTLIIHGMKDAIVPVAQAFHLGEYFNHCDVSLISDCGHAPHWHHPQQMAQTIEAFWNKL